MSRHALAALILLVSLAGASSADAQRAQVNGAGFVPNGWCKGNGNPNAAQCPIFAPGSTAPNTHTSHQPAQTANQLPTIPQQPTLPVLPMMVPPQPPQQQIPTPMQVAVPPQIVTPNPPQTITGYAPYMVPPQPAQVAVPPLLPQATPQLKPGYAAYPHYVGPRDPDTGYPVPPQPPQQQIPTLMQVAVPPQIVTPNPPQTITGYAPYMVPPQPPQQQTPTAIPGQVPTATPGAVPGLVPQLQQVSVPRPRPLPPQGTPPSAGQATVVFTPQGGGSHIGAELIAANPGRQAPNAIPVFDAKGTGDRWHCVASGHHIRKVFDDGGNEVYAGSLPGIAIQVVPIIRDVPAWHDLSSECIISVREHPKASAARR